MAFNGMPKSFEIIPKPENITFKLATSAFSIAPNVGAAMMKVAMNVTPPTTSFIQSAHAVKLVVRKVVAAEMKDAASIFAEDLASNLTP